MTLRSVEIASVFGALHSDELADGHPLDAHTLRTIARSSNLLASCAEPMTRASFSSRTVAGDEDNAALMGFGGLEWTQILPGPRTAPKKPGATSGVLDVIVGIGTSGDVIELAVETDAHRAALEPGESIMQITGDGSTWQTASLTGIPLVAGPSERITYYVRGRPSARAASTGTYGSPNSGTVLVYSGDAAGLGWMKASSATWNTTGSTLALGGHAVRFFDAGSSSILLGVAQIVDVAAADELRLWPGPRSLADAARLRGAAFEIVELPRWRFADLALFSEDRA